MPTASKHLLIYICLPAYLLPCSPNSTFGRRFTSRPLNFLRPHSPPPRAAPSSTAPTSVISPTTIRLCRSNPLRSTPPPSATALVRHILTITRHDPRRPKTVSQPNPLPSTPLFCFLLGYREKINPSPLAGHSHRAHISAINYHHHHHPPHSQAGFLTRPFSGAITSSFHLAL